MASWFRGIDLVTPKKLKGKELLLCTRGWWAIEPEQVAEIVGKYGKLVVGERGELMVEMESEATAESLSLALSKEFDDQVQLVP